MLVEYILGGIVTVALLIYLTYALLRPEKFYDLSYYRKALGMAKN